MHGFYALDYKYMSNGRKCNPQTVGRYYFKEIT
jgi:hypothetical protein